MEPATRAPGACRVREAWLLDQLEQLIETLDPVPASVLADARALFAAGPDDTTARLETHRSETVS
jgi:hypothetical protein